MEINRIKKTIAILLAVLFLITVTAGVVSADKDYKLKNPTVLGFKKYYIGENAIKKDKNKNLDNDVDDFLGNSDDTSQKTIKVASYRRTVSKS